MNEYRAYLIGRDGHIVGFEPLVCADDTEAIERARRLVVHAIELSDWRSKRAIKARARELWE
jgi:hypothetical protein